MCSSVYLNFALLAKAFASNHLHCGIFGTWTCTGTLAQQNHVKAKMSVPRSIPATLQLHYFCSATRSNLRSTAVCELWGPSEALAARGSQAKLVGFQMVPHTPSHKSWESFTTF